MARCEEGRWAGPSNQPQATSRPWVLLNNGSGGRELYYCDSAGQRYMAATDKFPERIRVWMGGAEIWYKPNASATAMEVDTEYATSAYFRCVTFK